MESRYSSWLVQHHNKVYLQLFICPDDFLCRFIKLSCDPNTLKKQQTGNCPLRASEIQGNWISLRRCSWGEQKLPWTFPPRKSRYSLSRNHLELSMTPLTKVSTSPWRLPSANHRTVPMSCHYLPRWGSPTMSALSMPAVLADYQRATSHH